MSENKKSHGWIGPVSFVVTAVAFVAIYTAVEGRTPDLGVCAKASIVVWLASTFVSAIIRTSLGIK